MLQSIKEQNDIRKYEKDFRSAKGKVSGKLNDLVVYDGDIKNGKERNQRGTTHRGTTQQAFSLVDNNKKRESVSISGNNGRGKRLFRIFGTKRTIEEIAKEIPIYDYSKNDTQANLLWHASKENVKLYFAENQNKENNLSILNGNIFVVDSGEKMAKSSLMSVV